MLELTARVRGEYYEVCWTDGGEFAYLSFKNPAPDLLTVLQMCVEANYLDLVCILWDASILEE